MTPTPGAADAAYSRLTQRMETERATDNDDGSAFAIRTLLIDPTDPNVRGEYPGSPPMVTMPDGELAAVRADVDTLLEPGLDARELLTTLALSLSLCPLHLHDYAICFDDDDFECALIRHIHPRHDT